MEREISFKRGDPSKLPFIEKILEVFNRDVSEFKEVSYEKDV